MTRKQRRNQISSFWCLFVVQKIFVKISNNKNVFVFVNVCMYACNDIYNNEQKYDYNNDNSNDDDDDKNNKIFFDNNNNNDKSYD